MGAGEVLVEDEEQLDTPQWDVQVYEDQAGRIPFEKWLRKEAEYVQLVVDAAIEHVLTPMGSDICSSEWGLPLGDGLVEFRVRQSLQAIRNWGKHPDDCVQAEAAGDKRKVLIRLFVSFQGSKIVLLLNGYNKERDPSKRRQQKEIKKAQRLLEDWKAREERA